MRRSDYPNYSSNHSWLRHNYGKASECEFDPSHTSRRFEWANISGESRRDVTDYIQLCKSCHRKYDFQKYGVPKRSIGQKKMCRNGHEYFPKNSYIDPRGFKVCRICRNAAAERSKKKNA